MPSDIVPDIEVSREIAAAPSAVFAALTDITRMGEWSPECQRAEWNDGFDGPAEGARFTGHNKNGDKEWSTEAEIVELVPDERFFFHCDAGGFVFSKWGYVIEPTEGGCQVTEYSQNLLPDSFKEQSEKISGVHDREPHNRAGMEQTLERLATALQ